MLGARVLLRRQAGDEAEKPFWISFADLMTALMVLFLLVMSVALLAVTKTVNEAEVRKAARERDITKLLEQIRRATDEFPGVSVNMDRGVIDFGDRARFDTGSSRLKVEQAKLLRSFVPKLLAIARNDLGKQWLKRIVVEGFADQRGTYLLNLNLSLQRSERLLCVLLAKPVSDEHPMNADELEQIRDLFLVGGYSFNSAKSSFDESRRIELRLEFYAIDEEPITSEGINRGNFGTCALAS
jgi:outer membrane protein OmpA-like peptidoglycan-associated protein